MAGPAETELTAEDLAERWAQPSVFFADMGWETADYQANIADALPVDKRVAARGPHGLGKTTISARLMIWFAIYNELIERDWKVVATSGSHFQLRAYLWPEVHKWVRKLDWTKIPLAQWQPGEELLKQGLSLNHGQAVSTSPEYPELIEGAHATAILIVFDESKAIADEIWNALEGALSTADASDEHVGMALAVSTPGQNVGRFYDIHRRRKGLTTWNAIHVTIDQAIAAKRISSKYPEEMGELWGVDSALYANRVLGEFRADDTDAVIPLSWIEAAVTRWEELRALPNWQPPPGINFGADIARLGKDKTVLAPLHGDSYVADLIVLPSAETTETATRIGEHIGMNSTGNVDATFNPGVYDILVKAGYKVTPFVGAKATDWTDETGLRGAWNTRSAAWWNLREALDPKNKPTLALPPNDLMMGDLAAPKIKRQDMPDPKNRIRLESKDQTQKRLGRSPDFGDAVVMAKWQEPVELVPEDELPPDDFGDGMDWSARP